MKFSEAMFAFYEAESEFDEAMVKAGFGAYERTGGDAYDNSIEFYGVANDARMSQEAQRIVFDAGYSRAYVNHHDGWETHYTWDWQEFKPARGWRRRWVVDPQASTTRSVGLAAAPDNAGYYEVSYWPESWGKQLDWRESGYMRIVPDPLEVANATTP